MLPLRIVDRTLAPDGSEFSLANRGEEWLVSVGGRVLMSNRTHHSEDELARLALDRCPAATRVLIGGLGMGFTTAAALARLTEAGHVTVAELLPALVSWNQQHLSHLANHPLRDPRCEVVVSDVYDVISRSPGAFDVIVLDVDNGPVAMSSESNLRLYSARGVRQCLAALRPGGILGVWSAGPSEVFEQRLTTMASRAEAVTVPAHPNSRSKHTLFFAYGPARQTPKAAPPPDTPATKAKPAPIRWPRPTDKKRR